MVVLAAERQQEVAWQDADTLLLAREWKPGETTHRHTPLS